MMGAWVTQGPGFVVEFTAVWTVEWCGSPYFTPYPNSPANEAFELAERIGTIRVNRARIVPSAGPTLLCY